jgi:thiol-disulfide isomerase/thioredoxin
LVQTAAAQKLTVIDQDYEQAKRESQAQNKLLLIDFYTTWCTPCRAIEKEIFGNPAIAEEMAKSFVLLRYDAEKDEAHRLALKHHVGSYPSTAVLNTDQFVVDKLYGFGGEDKDLEKNYRAFLEKAITANSRNEYVKGVSNTTKDLTYPKFYEDYVYRKNTKLDENALKNYWDTNTDLFSEVSFAIFTYFNGTDTVDKFFLDNLEKYEALFGKTDTLYTKSKMGFMKFSNAVDAKDRKKLAAAFEFNERLFGKASPDKYAIWEQYMLIEEKRWPEALDIFLDRKKREKLDDDATDNFCSIIQRKSDDKSVVKKCVALMKAVTDAKPEFEYLNDYAYLLYKAGDYKTSKKVLEKALEVGKLSKENTKNTEKWLKAAQDKINQKTAKK